MMIRPPSVMCFSAACVAANTPRTLMLSTRSISSSVVSSNAFGIAVPALFTRIFPSNFFDIIYLLESDICSLGMSQSHCSPKASNHHIRLPGPASSGAPEAYFVRLSGDASEAWGLKMKLRHLRYFVAVAETESLTLAAKSKLHTSQPSLRVVGSCLLTIRHTISTLRPSGRG